MDGTNISTPAIDLDNKNPSLMLSGKRPRQEDDAAKKRSTTISPATEQTSGDGPPRQASISVAESEAATEHIAAGSNTMMSMESIVAELNAHSTDDERDVINAAQTILKGNQNDIRTLCRPWGVQLTLKKVKRPMETIKQELKMAVTKRAKKLNMEHGIAEHTEVDARADDALAETLKESIATEHASAEFCIETAMDETLCRIKAIHSDFEFLVRVVDHACFSNQCVSFRIANM